MEIPLGPSRDPQAFRGHHRVAVAIVVAGMLVLVGRLALVQIVHGERYQKYTSIDRISRMRVKAQRGLVKDRSGEVLARNIESYSLVLMPHRVASKEADNLVSTLRELVDLTDAESAGILQDLRRPREGVRAAPIVVRRQLVSTFCPNDSAHLELGGDTPYRFCSTCGRSYESPPPPPRGGGLLQCPLDRKKLVPSGNGKGLHCEVCAREFTSSPTCPYDGTTTTEHLHTLHCHVCGRGYNDEVAVLRSNLHRLPGARIETHLRREYPYRYLASHLIGYMSLVTKEDLDAHPLDAARFAPDDLIGRAGLERALDGLLRGADGEQILMRSTNGREQDASDVQSIMDAYKPRRAVPGRSVRLTIDVRLQRVVKDAMSRVRSGAAVVIDPNTGDVLAIYSKPSLDPNIWSGRLSREAKERIDTNPYAPLLNKAARAFAPGSVYKIVAAIAGLEEGIITPDRTLYCPGHYEFGGRRFRCHLQRGHGEMNMEDALEKSCDVYFYRLGEMLGMETLEAYARRLGFGEPSGVEISESQGRVPSKDWYRERAAGWHPGFVLSTAVGQKDVLITPLQLARVYATVANGGTLPNLHVVQGIEGEEGGGLLPLAEKRPARRIDVKQRTLSVVRRGLWRVVNAAGGTAHQNALETVEMAGKTGTAEARQSAKPGTSPDIARWLQEDHAWFVGFAPFERPRLLIVVLVEHGGHGGNVSAPVVKRIADTYFRELRGDLAPLDSLDDADDFGGASDEVPTGGALDDGDSGGGDAEGGGP